MNKIGKYERRPEPKAATGVPANKVNTMQPQVKDVLLQTYFTSLLSLVLCVSMFLGTSYARFTSEVSNSENEIYVGTLKVGLYKEVFDNASNDVVKQDLSNTEKGYKLFDKSIRWEPGYTALETIQIVNEGDLAFKYVMTFKDGTLINGNSAGLTDVADVAEHFEVWVFNHCDPNYEYEAPASYDGISTEKGWIPLGTLAQILDGKTVLKGNMDKVRQDDEPDDPTTPNDTEDGVAKFHRFTIALHMNKTATSKVMGHKITLNVKLMAYQMASEQDAFGDDYDDKQDFVDDQEDLSDAVNSGKDVIMTKSITIDHPEYCLTMNGNSLDGQDYKIYYIGGLDNGSVVGVLNTSGGTITNLTIEASKYGRALSMTELKSNLIVKDCVLSGERAFILNSSKKNENASIRFENVRFYGSVSYANAATIAEFIECTFAADVRPYGDSKMSNCTFVSEKGIDITELVTEKAKDETVELINCFYNGVLIERAVLTSNGDGTVTITETDLLQMVTEEFNGKSYSYICLKSNG